MEDEQELAGLAIEMDLIKGSLYCAVLWLSACQVEGQKAQSSDQSISHLLFFLAFLPANLSWPTVIPGY